ncbi:MAG: UDP-N-acetylmuramate dehydrogenase [Roseburia sp.]|nr:UDP-N-acetylmuramate dehydrogenase [Roseburia sp.]
MYNEFLNELKEKIDASWIHENEPMKQHTTFRVGGPADVLIRPDVESLPIVIELCKKYKLPYHVIGNGSNLLVGDKGIRGVVIVMTNRAGGIVCDGEIITAGAGCTLGQIAILASGIGLAGFEFAAGIPGTLGGAVVMNAGAYGGEMKDVITSVRVLDTEGNIKDLSVEELDLSYRHSCIPEKGYLVLQVTLRLRKGDVAEIRTKMAELREQRLTKQPLEYPSAGSTFKRPTGYFAGKLIMEAGLRGYQVGGAQVAEKHCGFVINKDGATAADIMQLMQDVSDKVEAQFGVKLEPEVKMMGEF